MSERTHAQSYLTIPKSHANGLGGLHWSHGCDAIEDHNGETIILFEQLLEILEGVFSVPPVPPFCHILHGLVLLKRANADPIERMRREYTRAKGHPALSRNVGVFFSHLFHSLETCLNEPTWQDVLNELHHLRRNGEFYREELAVVPLLSPQEFIGQLEGKLARIDDAALAHWFRNAAEQSAAGEPLAEKLETLSERVLAIVKLSRNRPRLAGAASLVAAIDAALTFPNRRLDAETLPQGGYSDVTTRGDPDRLLPSQFALDPDDFIRRFAERELLYFRREDPHEAPKPERIIIVDQGVRTWGVVRHALAAAVLSILGKDAKRTGPARLFFDAQPRGIDPLEESPSKMASLLEASDLTANPAKLLDRAIDQPGTDPRDVILLTHPRSLRETAVVEAIRLLRPSDRFFALLVDESGQAELVEWLRTGPVSIRKFKVDLQSAEAQKVASPSKQKPSPEIRSTVQRWTGDVEPIVFPFRPGTLHQPKSFSFDADNRWLVYNSANGYLHAVDFESTSHPSIEILPRAMHRGKVFEMIEKILPVRDGVVVCGNIDLPVVQPSSITISQSSVAKVKSSEPFIQSNATTPTGGIERRTGAAHYDFRHRTVRFYDFGMKHDFSSERFHTIPGIHAVAFLLYQFTVVSKRYEINNTLSKALDLDTEQFVGFDSPHSPARQLLHKSAALFPSFDFIPVNKEISDDYERNGTIYLLHVDGELELRNVPGKGRRFRPTQDGENLFSQSSTLFANLVGEVLTIIDARGDYTHRTFSLYLYDVKDWSSLCHIKGMPHANVFCVSPSGQYLAYLRKDVAVLTETRGNRERLVVPNARLHVDPTISYFRSRPFELIITIGKNYKRFACDEGRFHAKAITQQELAKKLAGSIRGTEDSNTDSRFRANVEKSGQIVITNSVTNESVLHLLSRKNAAAAWLPDGTYWGDPLLSGSAETPDAAERIAESLDQAIRRES